jgi:hypothetical protein
MEYPLINKGTGAGGSMTNISGKSFEEKTDNEDNLLNLGFVKTTLNDTKCGYYLKKDYKDKSIVYVSQSGLKIYMKEKYNIDMFRCPDEAYIITYKRRKHIVIKILEKKAQNGNGSVETKLWAGNSLKREYMLVLGNMFKVEYAFTISSYLENKMKSNHEKYNILNKILNEDSINVFYGDSPDYINNINNWIGTLV